MSTPPAVSTLSTEHLQYLLEKHGKAPLYWNYTREQLELELRRRNLPNLPRT